ncbi:MAG: hypothetical protein J6Z23_03400 [Lachnospiraceae bacterium]|nr:hypothetical protein [Lachnospiraceae bacterium]
MDKRWYERAGERGDIFLASRIRLLRNFDGILFPSAMSDEQRQDLEYRMDSLLPALSASLGEPIERIPLKALSGYERSAVRERHLINDAAFAESAHTTLYVSRDEACSLTVNARDHLRILLSERGEQLNGLLERINRLDDAVCAGIPYAFSPKYGYKTARIRDLGTGMRAYYVMHLPLLSEREDFGALVQEIGKYGVVIKEAWTVGARKVGGVYVLYNQRTLGLKEEDIVAILTNVGDRLMKEEQDLRHSADPELLRDRVFRSYGTLKYAVRLETAEACRFLSDILLGVSEQYLKAGSGASVYELMLGIFPGNLQVYFREPLTNSEIPAKRAEYVRGFLKNFTPVRF